MKVSSILLTGLSGVGMASARYVAYVDKYHTTTFPNITLTEMIDHAIMTWLPSSSFISDPHGNWSTFEPAATFRTRFNRLAKSMVSIGTWTDTGFHDVLRNDSMIQLFASNVALMLKLTGLDGVDINYQYPGGNGYDQRFVSNEKLTYEIDAFPKLLAAIRKAIGPDKILSIAVPGLERDMIGYTSTTLPLIAEQIDFANIMTYNLVNRRSVETNHHTSVRGSLEAIDLYLARGLPAKKANLGFAFYAKWFALKSNQCTEPMGCPLPVLEDDLGDDNGLSGDITFELTTLPPTRELTVTELGGVCGGASLTKCQIGQCCSQYNYCGITDAHCGISCQPDYGNCTGSANAIHSWRKAQSQPATDETQGGQYYFDNVADPAKTSLFFTWDTRALVDRKFAEIVVPRKLGGVMAFSLAEDSARWDLLREVNWGVANNRLSEVVGYL